MRKIITISLTLLILISNTKAYATNNSSYTQLTLKEIIINNQNITKIVLLDKQRNIEVSFKYYAELEEVEQYLSSNTIYKYDYNNDKLVISHLERILFDDNNL